MKGGHYFQFRKISFDYFDCTTSLLEAKSMVVIWDQTIWFALLGLYCQNWEEFGHELIYLKLKIHNGAQCDKRGHLYQPSVGRGKASYENKSENMINNLTIYKQIIAHET